MFELVKTFFIVFLCNYSGSYNKVFFICKKIKSIEDSMQLSFHLFYFKLLFYFLLFLFFIKFIVIDCIHVLHDKRRVFVKCNLSKFESAGIN